MAPNAGEDVEQQDPQTLLVGTQNGTAALEDSWAVSYKTIFLPCIWSRNHAPWYLPEGAENLYPHENLHMDVYSGLIHNCQNLEQPRCPSVGEWVNHLWRIQTTECYSELKRNELSSHRRIRRNHKGLLLSERSQCEKAKYCMIPLWHSGKEKTMETVRRLVFAGVWKEGGKNRGGKGDF